MSARSRRSAVGRVGAAAIQRSRRRGDRAVDEGAAGRRASPPRGRTRTSRASSPPRPDRGLPHQRQIGHRDRPRPAAALVRDRGRGRRRCRAAPRSPARGRSARATQRRSPRSSVRSVSGRGGRTAGRPRPVRRRTRADGEDAGHLLGDRHDHRVEADGDPRGPASQVAASGEREKTRSPMPAPRPKTVAEVAGADRGDFRKAGARPVSRSMEVMLDLVEPAGDDPREVGEVGRDVQGEAVGGDPPREVDADRGDLLLPCPDADERLPLPPLGA